MNRAIDAIPTEALRQLMSWDWSGNVRELENVIERAVLLTRGNSLNLHLNVRQSRLLPTLNEDSALRSSMAQLLHPTTPENDEEERQRIVQVLRETNGIVAGPPWRSDAIRDEAHHAAVTNAAAGDLGSRGVVICFCRSMHEKQTLFRLAVERQKSGNR